MVSKRLYLSAIAIAVLGAVAVVFATASYPSSVKSFSTKLAGQTISAAHINDIQDEIVAIEGALLNGFAHALKPSSSGAQDLGTSSLPWGTLYVNNISGGGGDSVCGRLTLTSGTPVTSADVTAATSLYYTPDGCNQISLYDGSTAWSTVTFSQLTLSVPGTTSQMYDVWIYNNAGTATIEALAWTNDTTRATALVRQDGRWVKTGATTRRYVGSFRTTTVSGQTEDSCSKRYVWNMYHRVQRSLCRAESTTSWTYTTATIRQANNSTSNQVDVVVGVAEIPIDVVVAASCVNGNSDGTKIAAQIGIGEDSTTAFASGMVGGALGPGVTTTGVAPGTGTARLVKYPAVGKHYYAWLEWSQANGTTTWYGTPAVISGPSGPASGISGWILG